MFKRRMSSKKGGEIEAAGERDTGRGTVKNGGSQ